ncbi:MAG TPA: right-handed parallel beta-helix repeat-containing protein [Candidatus Binatia bacterium]|jgi:hypothetical protein
MNYFQPYALDETIVAAWDSQIAETPWLAQSAAAQSADLFPRFATCYAKLRALPRGSRRALQRQLARSQGPAAIPLEWQPKLARALAGAALLLALRQGSVQAATITVNTNIPKILADGKCSLVEAMVNANDTATGQPYADCAAGDPTGADTIILRKGTQTLVDFYYYGLGLPPVTSQITIQGNGAKIVRAKNAPDFGLFLVRSYGGDLTLNNLTLSGGTQYVGAVSNHGTLRITNCVITGNRAVSGGGIYNRGLGYISDSTISTNRATFGGGVFNIGSLRIINSVITGNTASGFGGGVDNAYSISLSIENSTITKNSSDNGGGVSNYGGTFKISNSTISKNTAIHDGGGVYNNPAYDGSSSSIIGSTITGNSSVRGGGVFNSRNNYSYGFKTTLSISNSTISKNSATNGGGIFSEYPGAGLATMLYVNQNSTIQGNKAGNDGGGVYNGSYFYLDNSAISKNSAGARGGGVFNATPYVFSPTNSTISGNKAAVGPNVFL